MSLLTHLKNTRRHALVWLVGSLIAGAASAQNYPSRPIRMIVPFASGSSDALARVVAPKLGEVLGQQIIIDNKPGAGTMLGTRLAAQAPADGYTVLFAAPSILTNSLAYREPGYKMADFTAVAPIISQSFILSVRSGLPVRTLAELVAYGKANPGKLNSASLGASSVTTLTLERFKAGAGVETTNVPYPGGGAAQMALLGGFVDLFMDGAVNTLTQAKSPQLRMLAITGDQRSPLAPDVPTFKELGYPQVVVRSWTALFVPARTPDAVVQKLRTAMTTVLADPQMQSRLQAMGLDLWREKAEEFPEHMKHETGLWEQDVRRAKLQLD